MARHLCDLTPEEFEDLQNRFADRVLEPANVAGSIGEDYSLYRALEDEWERAHKQRKAAMESDEFEHVLATERAAKMAKAMNFEKRDGDAAQQGALPVSPFAAHLERLRALVLADGATGMGRLPAEDVAAIEALIARWDMAVRLYQEWQQAVGRLGAVLFG